jgi:AcrR family transcriptional regulator
MSIGCILDTMSTKVRKQHSRKVDNVSSTNSRIRILDAALALISRRGEADVTMADIGKAARVSRQAVYLHFADRADLFLALVRHVDEKRGLSKEVQKVLEAPSGTAALRAAASAQARLNPRIWAVAHAVDAVRRIDRAAEQSWQDRMKDRWRACRSVVSRLSREGTLRSDLDPSTAADMLWTLTSLHTWEDLVLQRRWTAKQYEERVTRLLLGALT